MFRLFVLISTLCVASASSGDEPARYDIVVYGGSSGGVAAAVQAQRMGKSVLLVNPYRHLGGMTSSGLGRTDAGQREVIGGLARQFYRDVYRHYLDESRWTRQSRDDYFARNAVVVDDTQWHFEPHVAEQIFTEWLSVAGVAVIHEHLDRGEGGVRVRGRRIDAIVTESGRTIHAAMFIDASYEGDLMAAAGVSYTVGREANAQYDETLNGIQTKNTVNHAFTVGSKRGKPPWPLPEAARIDPYVKPGDPASGLLPGVNPDAGGADGEADRRVQAYCYRLCLTDVPDNRVPFTKPPGYDERDYELLFRMFEAGETRTPWLPAHMPNRKTDTNNRWAVSTDFIGGADEYPEASYARRREIEQTHEQWQRGLLWTLAHHPRVPQHVRREVSQWGYARDEFADNDHWPYMIYIREARRMVSDYVMTEHDCRLKRTAPDSVGMGSYGMDSHNVQRYVTPEGYVQNEGNIEVGVKGPYAISYRSIVPRRGEAENLLVSSAVSASHIAYGSIRMEPVFMILGQSAATAAAIAIDDNVPVQSVNYEKLRQRLEADGQILYRPKK